MNHGYTRNISEVIFYPRFFLGPTQTPTLKRPEADFWDPTKVVFLNGNRFIWGAQAKGGG